MRDARHNTPRPHAADPGLDPASAHAPAGGRLNLLLSYGGWESDPWVHRLPVLLEPMGVRAVHASTGREANEVLRSTPIHVAVVDLSLPMETTGPAAGGQATPAGPVEAGPKLLELLARLASPPPTLVVKRRRASRDDEREIRAALRAGAFAVLDRPRAADDLELVLEVLRRVIARHYRGRWPGDATA